VVAVLGEVKVTYCVPEFEIVSSDGFCVPKDMTEAQDVAEKEWPCNESHDCKSTTLVWMKFLPYS
jgi:hypothetical protein